MTENIGFVIDLDDDDAIENTPDIDDVLPPVEDIYQDDVNEAHLGRLREGTDRIGKPFLGKLAKARLIAARSGQLQLGAPPLIFRDQLRSSELNEIALQEFDEAVAGNLVFPIKIIRKYADGTYEIWRISDFKYFVRDIGRSQRSRQRK
jgi:DNA-directed RNA polymerase subunit K/omega